MSALSNDGAQAKGLSLQGFMYVSLRCRLQGSLAFHLDAVGDWCGQCAGGRVTSYSPLAG
jgi:hypothetical protein